MLKTTRNNQTHGFHLVDVSPWPFLMAWTIFCFTVYLVAFMHGYLPFKNTPWNMIFLGICGWGADIVRESFWEGQHTSRVQKGLKLGFLLFIVSEVMFFFAFFWAFFHSSLNPSPFIGGVWPPAHLVVLSPWGVPLLNTVILLSSGAFLTLAHHELLAKDTKGFLRSMVAVLSFAYIFFLLQKYEYLTASFTISDGIYGSTFYMTTGFHGFHVIVGSILLFVVPVRITHYENVLSNKHLGFETAAWYWHFVDVVWLFLFITMYWWGSN
jgi:cytochrome c oxidase subunit 3